MNRFNEVMYVVRDSLKYSIFEVVILFAVLADILMGDGVNDVLLIAVATIAVVWVISASTEPATEEARDMVEEHELFATDFMMSAAILILIAIMYLSANVAWYYTALIGVAIGQNLRYTWLSIHWIRERIANEQQRKGHNSGTDDHMS